MLTRRQFLAAGAATLGGLLLRSDGMIGPRLLMQRGGSSTIVAPWYRHDDAPGILDSVASRFAANEITVTVGGVAQATGYKPANGDVYNALWTRDHAYVVYHHPDLLTATERRQFVTYYLSRRTTGVESDPDGGSLPANFIADRISSTGTATYKNAGASKLPFMDGIHFLVLVLWTDYRLTGSTSTYTSNKSAIDTCLAAIPRSGSGCVYSDPAQPSVDYGFTDTIKKTGDVAYGTALQAWAYKMLDEISNGGSSVPEADTYANLRAEAEAGLATLRQGDGWYAGSSVNNADRDDVWATALIVAEGLVSGSDRTASAQALADAYDAGTIAQNGWVRHLPTGQNWVGTSTSAGSYQNGGYWLTPLWDCTRAVALVDTPLAREWVDAAMDQLTTQIASLGTNAPLEWRNGGTVSGPKGYTAHAALVNRFV